jgi:hypothetical protein
MDIRTVYVALGVGYLPFGLVLVAFERGLAKFLMISYGLLAVASVGRAVWAWTEPGEALLFAAHPLHLFMFGLLYFMLLTSGFGVLLTAMTNAQARVERLEGILSLCMYCRKIRNADDAWEQLERYVATHTDARFSHGICPDCLPRVHAEIDRQAGTRRPGH